MLLVIDEALTMHKYFGCLCVLVPFLYRKINIVLFYSYSLNGYTHVFYMGKGRGHPNAHTPNISIIEKGEER